MMDYSADWMDLISHFGYGKVDDIEQYKFILKIRAYTDMQPRTIRGLKEFHETPENHAKLDSLFDDAAKMLHSFVTKDPKKSEDEFDKWHEEKCKWFVEEFNEKIKGSSVEEIAFGKGQKLINCSLKYIYCLKGADKFSEKFEHCHMILDRYTYSEGFYKKEVIDWYNNSNPNEKKKKTGLTAWSNLEYDDIEDGKDVKYGYKTIQKDIRSYLKDGKHEYKDKGTPLTPFQAEFYVFDKYQKILNSPRASKESKPEQ